MGSLLSPVTPALPSVIDLRCADARNIEWPEADLVLTDPPWSYTQSPGQQVNVNDEHYAGLAPVEIAAILGALPAPRLAMWATWPLLGEWSQATENWVAWGRPTTGWAWVKSGPGDSGHYGPGYHWSETMDSTPLEIAAVDLFCGAGGLTYGLQMAGVPVVAGIDLDEQSRHAFTANNGSAKFLAKDISQTPPDEVVKLFGDAGVRVLAGCAPCQPFSKYTNGKGKHAKWSLLLSFEKLVREVKPEVVTMENVPELATRGKEVFKAFTDTLEALGYSVDWAVVDAVDYGVPQNRKRLVLLASRLGPIQVPTPKPGAERTVRETIAALPALGSGEQDPKDRIHVAAKLSSTNLERVRATPPDGGTRAAWPKHLLPPCYQRSTGDRYVSVYGRMWWDRPAPTMTTLCNGIGNGRFGHPEQDRAITLREAALIQSFPPEYDFWPENEKLNTGAIARMIGNAVPPELGRALGETIVKHIREHTGDGSGAA